MSFYSEESYSKWIPFLQSQKENMEEKTYQLLQQMKLTYLDYSEMEDREGTEIGIYCMEAKLNENKHEIYFTDYLEECKLEWGTPFQEETFFSQIEQIYGINEEEKIHMAFVIQEFFSTI